MGEANYYEERLSSAKTEALFILLALVFGLLLAWRFCTAGLDWLAWVCVVLFLFFLFCSLNYRTLVIRIDGEALTLKYGLISWKIPLGDIAECYPDNPPAFTRLGGAGVHFYTHAKRYRASFNFLEYPRVAVLLKQKKGLVQEVSFSTRQPEQVLRRFQAFGASHTEPDYNG